MTVSLQQAFANNAAVLGANCEHLGSRRGIYLSFIEKKGWSVVKFEGFLGLFQQIFRWLGFYASTQLSRVVAQLRAEADVPAPLLAKINACWTRHGGIPIVAHRIPPAAPADAVPRIEIVVRAPRLNDMPGIGLDVLPQISDPDDLPPADLPPVREPRVRVPDPDGETEVGYRIPGSETLIAAMRGDILLSNMRAIVTQTDPSLTVREGVAGESLHDAAGLEVSQALLALPVAEGVRCQVGHAVMTRGGHIARASEGINTAVSRIIHAVIPYGPVAEPWRCVAEATRRSLDLARLNGVRSVAFRVLNNQHVNAEDAIRAMCRVIHMYIQRYPDHFNAVKMVTENQEAFDFTRDEMIRVRDIPAGQ